MTVLAHTNRGIEYRVKNNEKQPSEREDIPVKVNMATTRLPTSLLASFDQNRAVASFLSDVYFGPHTFILW